MSFRFLPNSKFWWQREKQKGPRCLAGVLKDCFCDVEMKKTARLEVGDKDKLRTSQSVY